MKTPTAFLILVTLSTYIYGQAPHHKTITSNEKRVASVKNIFLVHKSRPNAKTKRIVEQFLTLDEQGREIIHSVLFSGAESVFISVSDQLPLNQSLFVIASADTASISAHTKDRTLLVYIDSLSSSLSSTTLFTPTPGMSTVVMLNAETIGNSYNDESGGNTNDIKLISSGQNIFLIQLNKNILRGGPRFRRDHHPSR